MLKKNLRFPADLKSAVLTGADAGASRQRPFSGAPPSRWQAVGTAVLVLALHAAVFYAIARTAQTTPPQLSVPLTVSFATSAEPVRDPPKLAPPKPRPKSPPVERRPLTKTPPSAPVTKPEPEPAPPSVSAPRFDVAYLNNPAPAYPSLSRRLGEEGRVLLRVFVAPEGHAREVHVQSSSGHARLDRAAQEAVERWRFVPARRGQEAVGAWVLVPIAFTLKPG